MREILGDVLAVARAVDVDYHTTMANLSFQRRRCRSGPGIAQAHRSAPSVAGAWGVRVAAVLGVVLLVWIPGCGEDQSRYSHFASPTPPSPENWALCQSVCEKAACQGRALTRCASDCADSRNEYLDCEYRWSAFLRCQMNVKELTCDEDGVTPAPHCVDAWQRYFDCSYR